VRADRAVAFAALLIAGCVTARPALAQRSHWAPASFRAGQRVRVKQLTNEVTTGVLREVRGDSIEMARDEGGDVVYSFARIAEIDSSTGVRTHRTMSTLKSALIGGVSAFGRAIMTNHDHPCEGPDYCLTNDAGITAWRHAGIGAAIGTTAGLFWGSRRSEDWKEILPIPVAEPIPEP
jgi:hypothetical protein